MRKTLKRYVMTRFGFLILIFFSLIVGSCSGRKTKLDKKNLIPEKELVSLLTDIHIADGLLAIPKINYWASSLDSITSYYQVIEKHGYTKEMMDKTMKYYFLNDPKKLNKIYDQVLGILTEMESKVEKESNFVLAHITNKWPAKEFYSFPSLSGNDSTQFDITLSSGGTYSLSFSATLFPDDQSANPRPTVYSCNPDSVDTGKRNYIKSINYIKDGRPHIYKLFFTLPANQRRHLRGWLYDFDNRPYGTEKHIKIDNISLTFSSQAS
jgi:Domain of unknown function (DUF4296)